MFCCTVLLSGGYVQEAMQLRQVLRWLAHLCPQTEPLCPVAAWTEPLCLPVAWMEPLCLLAAWTGPLCPPVELQAPPQGPLAPLMVQKLPAPQAHPQELQVPMAPQTLQRQLAPVTSTWGTQRPTQRRTRLAPRWRPKTRTVLPPSWLAPCWLPRQLLADFLPRLLCCWLDLF